MADVTRRTVALTETWLDSGNLWHGGLAALPAGLAVDAASDAAIATIPPTADAAFVGTSNDDTLTGTASDDTFDLSQGGNDTVYGLGGDDIFNMGGALTGADTIDGGTGNDTVVLNGDYSSQIALSDTSLTSIETLTLSDGNSYDIAYISTGKTAALTVDGSQLGSSCSLVFSDAGSNFYVYVPTVIGGAGNDTIIVDGGGYFAKVDISQGGDDRVVTQASSSGHVYAGAAFTAADSVVAEWLELDGDYSAGLVLANTTLQSCTKITLDAGYDYKLTIADEGVINYALSFDATRLATADSVWLDVSASSTKRLYFESNAGTNHVVGTQTWDQFVFYSGTIYCDGQGGDDVFDLLNSSYSPDVVIIGGEGNDTLGIGTDATSMTLTGAQISGVEAINVSPVLTTMSVTLGADLVPDGKALSLSVVRNLVNEDCDVTVDGSAVAGDLTIDTHIGDSTLIGGSGDDVFRPGLGEATLYGGSGDDTFVMLGMLDSGDRIDGGDGYDTLTMMTTSTLSNITMTADMMRNVERLVIGSFWPLDLTMSDANVSAGATLTVDASAFTGTFSFDCSTETDGNYIVIGSAGADTINGGAGNDTYTGGAGNDIIFGGLGADTAVFSGNLSAYTITRYGNGSAKVSGPDGTDTLANIEWLQFADQTISIRTVSADADDDGRSDIFWQNDSGQAAIWTMNGLVQLDGSPVGGNPGTSWTMIGTGDFNGDGTADILWQNDNGQAAIWTMDGLTQLEGSYVGGNPGSSWHAIGTGDFNGDGYADILWQNDSGQAAIWTMNGFTQLGGSEVGINPGSDWHVICAADFNGDGTSDILWQNDNGQAAIWIMKGFNVKSGSYVGGNPGTDWHVVAAADFNGDGKADILWQNDNGQAAIWTMDGLTQIDGSPVGGNPGSDWHIVGTGDYNGDGCADILWQNDNGQAAIWTMNGLTQTGGSTVGGNPGTSWHVIT